MSAETADLLQGAADVVRARGWHQGWFHEYLHDVAEEECAVCAVGSIAAADGGPPYRWETPAVIAAMRAVVNYLGLTLHTEYDSAYVDALGVWNDDPDRTAEQVIAALEGAAAAERSAAP